MKKYLPYFFCIAAVVICIIVCIVVWACGSENQTNAAEAELPAASEEPDRRVVYKEVDKFVEVEKEFTSEIIADGLKAMGELVTQEYYFTEVMSYSSIKNWCGVEIGLTESSYIASYDGTIEAGIDFSGIRVRKDEGSGVITVTVPEAEIFSISIDPESFVVYEEKTGIGNSTSISNYNNSVLELETNAKEKAIERGLLEEADKNAENLISNFILSMIGNDYAIVFE